MPGVKFATTLLVAIFASCNAQDQMIHQSQEREVPNGLIVNGVALSNEKVVNGFPIKNKLSWMVSLGWTQNGRWMHFCGGSLVTSQWVMSAAHCFVNEYGQDVGYITQARIGGINHTNVNEFEVYDLESPIVHPNFTDAIVGNDIALIKLKGGLYGPYSPKTPILVNKDPTIETAGRATYALGWGYESWNSQTLTTVLRGAGIPIAINAQCKPNGYPNLIDSMLCAGYAQGTRDTCGGDSGGPLYLPAQNGAPDTLVGITSWGNGCGSTYGIYTRVSSFSGWVESILGKLPTQISTVQTVYSNTNVSATLPGGSQNTTQACVSACQSTPYCNAFTWDNTTCVLKRINSFDEAVLSPTFNISLVVLGPKINGGWSSWGECTAKIGKGMMYRSCTNPVAQNGGAGCSGISSQQCAAWSTIAKSNAAASLGPALKTENVQDCMVLCLQTPRCNAIAMEPTGCTPKLVVSTNQIVADQNTTLYVMQGTVADSNIFPYIGMRVSKSSILTDPLPGDRDACTNMCAKYNTCNAIVWTNQNTCSLAHISSDGDLVPTTAEMPVLFLMAAPGKSTLVKMSTIRPDGRCGHKYPLWDGRPGQCDPKTTPCCSADGQCVSDENICGAVGARDFRLKSTRADNRCGPNYRIKGQPSLCDPTGNTPCCSAQGRCGATWAACNSSGSIEYRIRK